MATQNPLQPKDKTDSKWLRDAGYPGGMPQFMTSYGLRFPDEIDKAKELINGFRNDDQEKWEASNTSNEPSQCCYKSIANYCDLEKHETDPKIIETAMLWHARLGHANYHAVKQAPRVTTGMGVDFTELNIEDMPACPACTAAGLNPFEEDC